MKSLIVAILAASVWLILSAAVGNFAERKGHSGTLWYLFSLLLSPLIGFAVVAVLPSAAALRMDVAYRKCPDCSAMVLTESEICPSCGTDLTGVIKGKRAA